MKSTELYHHGIKGQKWHVKNGPPYPLSRKKKKDNVKVTKDTKKNTALTKDNKDGDALMHSISFTESDSMGFIGETKTVIYYTKDNIVHYSIDGNTFISTESEKDIERKIKASYRRGEWGDTRNFSRMLVSIDNGNDLYHHGTLGQKWHVKNGPPYPLYRQDGYRKSPTGKSIKVTAGEAKNNKDSKKKLGSALTSEHDKEWKEVYISDRGDIKDPTLMFKKIMEANVAKETLADKGDISDYELDSVNPNYGERGTTQNCTKTSALLELLSREHIDKDESFDIVAGRQTYPSSINAMDESVNDVMDKIHSYGSYSSGAIGAFSNDFGHMMHWTNKNGKFEIQDGQISRRFKDIPSMMEYYGFKENYGIDLCRLDDKEPNWDMMREDSVVRIVTRNQNKSKVYNKRTGKVVDTW